MDIFELSRAFNLLVGVVLLLVVVVILMVVMAVSVQRSIVHRLLVPS